MFLKRPVNSDLRLLLRQLHVVEDAEDDSEEVVPPVLLEGVAVTLHDLEHDGETSVRRQGQKRHQSCCSVASSANTSLDDNVAGR